MALTINSYSQFKLYFAEPTNLRSCYKVDLDEINDVTSNSGLQVSFHPKERKDFIKGDKSKFITGWDLAVVNVAYFPFKALKEYVEYQLAEYMSEKAKVTNPVKGANSEEDLFDIFIEPRILVYRKFGKENSERFLEQFVSELELAFKKTFAITAFDQKELNKILLEILNLRKKNRIVGN